MSDLGLTVFDLKNLKGKRTIKFVQVDTLDQAIAAKEAGIEMIGTGYAESKSHFPKLLEMFSELLLTYASSKTKSFK